jgi:O-antigen ligase
VAGGLGERGENPVAGEARPERLVSVKSRRYDYWRVGADAFADQPFRGVGSGAFAVVWLRERPVQEGAVDAHSLPLETAAELGLVGLVALALFLGGVGLVARRAAAREPELVAGALAAATAWLLHAAIDWDWEMPAVTLPALVMAGALVAAAEVPRRPGED